MTQKAPLLHEIIPLEYDILLKPDLESFIFSGEETLTCTVQKPTKTISLHAQNLTITQAYILEKAGKNQAEISYNKKEMTVTLHFSQKVLSGNQRIQLVFTGIISDQLIGWYKSKHTVNGKDMYLATTQFEEIGARRVFPSIDDPSAKAIFHIALTVPSHLTAISNTIDQKVVEHENGYKTVSFLPTPKMATYALAFIVGKFDFIEKTTSSGVKVRVFVTPGKISQAQFALDTAVRLLPFYEDYFGIPYPLPVLDLIAIPDFDAGAMENWGAITAREVALLVDEKETSLANKQWVAVVVAHELTHMWFGNLVTMKWWEDLWLNEGFASYMEYVGVNYLFPQWHMWEQFTVLDHNRAMGLDSLKNTHPIQVDISSVEKIAENFDEVSYSKGASIIQMIATFLGEDVFQEGLRYYLKKHAYGNAQTKDLWEALEHVSQKSIQSIMQNFTQRPGYPIIQVTTSNKSLQLIQERFFSNAISRQKSKDTTIWKIPLKNLINNREQTMQIDKKIVSLPLPQSWIKLNSGETSFVRTLYDDVLYEKLQKPISEKQLSSIDRMGVLRDAFDGAESGYTSVVKALELAKSYINEDAYIVWASLSGKLGKVENLLNNKEIEKQFALFAQKIFTKIGERVGWEKKSTDVHQDVLLRAIILSSLGTYKHKITIEKAQMLFEKVVTDKSQIDTDIRGVVYAVTAENGGVREFEQLKQLYIQEGLSAEKNRIGNAMCLFEDPKLVQKALLFSLTNHVRTQDIGRFLVIGFGNKYGREVTWQFVKDHWDELLAKMEGIEMDWIIDGAASIVSESLAKEIFTFFKSHPHPKLNKAMQQVKEQIVSNIAWAERDRQAIENFLTKEV